MRRLGYDRYGAQSGDVGAGVSPDLGRVAPIHVVGVHVNAATLGFMPFPPLDDAEMAQLTDAEKARVQRIGEFMAEDFGYAQIQSTRPQTLAYGLTDSPVGQLAWIVEKFKEWTHGTERRVQAIDVDTRTVSFADGGQLRYALLLAVPQALPPQVVADSPLAGEGGWIQPDRQTLLTRFERVYAAGDCTASPPPKAGIFAEAEARVGARNIAAEIDGGPGDLFDGTGYCFLEFPGQRASALEGQFFAQPPEVRLAEPDTETFARKQAFETERLRDWLDVGVS